MGKGLEMTSLSEGELHGRRVLVADDEGPTRWSYVGLLRNAGARVIEARDGAEALELARSHPPDVIVADMVMPRLDGLGLCAALRREPGLEGVTVVLLSDGAPPQAVWGAGARSRPMVDAVISALSSDRASPEGAKSGIRPSVRATTMREEPGEPAVDLAEREDIRVHSMVAMHREPANRVSRGAFTVWRLRAAGASEDAGSASGFGLKLDATSRLFGAGFLMLLAGTVGLLVWAGLRTPEVIEAPVTVVTPVTPKQPKPDAAVPPTRAAPRTGVGAFSGMLRAGVSPILGASAAQGALELSGPGDVRVDVDGADLGSLPIAIPLDEGRHVVRYHFEERSIDRVYFVRRGTTRTLRVITRPGGFVDAR